MGNGDSIQQKPRPKPPKVTDPIKAMDIFSNDNDLDYYRQRPSTDGIHDATYSNFRPENYPYLEDPKPTDDPFELERQNARAQPFSEKLGFALTQFGANSLSAFGQGIANALDLGGHLRSLRGGDNYVSYLGTLGTDEMAEWAQKVESRNRILQANPGKFDPGDMGWILNQVASAGTGFGMAISSLLETGAIELATGGTGTGVAIARLGNLFSKLIRGGKGARVFTEAMAAARGMKSAATVYGIMSRVGESRMESMMIYQQAYEEASSVKMADGVTDRYTEEEKKKFASEAAGETMRYNLAMLPLDILSYRAMVFNPVSGAAETWLERSLAKAASIYGKGKLGKAAGYATGKLIGFNAEGFEEGFQYIGEEEGLHAARVMSGREDGSTLGQRILKDVQTDAFWNNYAGGVIGAPIIGGAMNVLQSGLNGQKRRQLAAYHKGVVSNVGKMNYIQSETIKALEYANKGDLASKERLKFNARNTIEALHADAMTNKDTAYEAKLVHTQGIIDEIKAGKTDALNDLGYFDLSAEQLKVIQAEHETMLQDSKDIKGIYDNIKFDYNKNFLPEIVQQHFVLKKLNEAEPGNEARLVQAKKSLGPEYAALTDTGKAIHDIEYQAAATDKVLNDLTVRLDRTEDEQERENVRSLIRLHENRAIELKNRLKEIQDPATYNQEERDKNRPILRALKTLKNKEYQQAIYGKESLEAERMLIRENIALWEDEKYLKNRFDDVTKNATSKEQLDALQQQASGKPQNETTITETPVVATNVTDAEKTTPQPLTPLQLQAQAAIQKRKAELDAEALANQVKSGANDNADPEAQKIVASIDAAMNTQAKSVSDVEEGQDLLQWSPLPYDFNRAPNESKALVKKGIGLLLDRLGANASFEDLARFFAANHPDKIGILVADQKWNALIYGWESNGRPKVDYEAVHDKIFGDPYAMIEAGLAGIGTLEADRAANEIIEDTSNQQTISKNFDANGQPRVNYDPNMRVTSESQPKASYSHRPSMVIMEENEDTGEWMLSRQYTGEIGESKNSAFIDSNILMDPDFTKAGVKTIITKPANYKDYHITVYTPDGTYVTTQTFGQWEAETGFTEDSQEWKDKVPMVHHIVGYDNGGKAAFSVHDVEWYSPQTFNQDNRADMLMAIANTRAIREEVLAAGEKGVPSTITGVKQTTFDGFKMPRGTDLTVKEANPQVEFALKIGDNPKTGLIWANGMTVHNSTTHLTNSNEKGLPGRPGDVFDVRRMGTIDGTESWTAFPVIRPDIAENIQETVLQAITIYANGNNLTDEQIKTVNLIRSIMGMNITHPSGLDEYLSHFIQTNSISGVRTAKNSPADLTAQIIADVAASQMDIAGKPFIHVEKGAVVFGQAGVVQSRVEGKDAEGNAISTEVKSLVIHPSKDNAETLKALTKPIIHEGKTYSSFLSWFKYNLNKEAYSAEQNSNRKRAVLGIDKNGTAITISNSYKDFLMSNFRTNIKSFNIGTEENPKFVTNLQPLITYDTDSRLAKVVEGGKTHAEIVKEALGGVKPETKKEVKPEVVTDDDIDKLLKEGEDMLGPDAGISGTEDSNLSALPMSEAQAKMVADAMTNIAGLTDRQQYDIVNFMMHQILPVITRKGGRISEEEMKEVVDNALREVIDPIKVSRKIQVDRYNEILANPPASLTEEKRKKLVKLTKDFETSILKIDAIYASIGSLYSLARNKAAKYTNIKTTRDLVEDSENESEDPSDGPEDTKSDDEGNDREIDFYTDILTESPEHKVSRIMRRFFGEVLDYTKLGAEKKAFLGLPAYTSPDQIVRFLMTSLVDVPSNFDTMIAKLEELKETHTWMPAVIEKLKAASPFLKDSFTTAMSNTSLRMKFSFIGHNRITDTWYMKVRDTNMSSVAEDIEAGWKNRFETDGVLTNINEDDVLTMKQETVQKLIADYKALLGWDIVEWKEANALMQDYKPDLARVGSGSATFKPKGATLAALEQLIQSNEDKVRAGVGGYQYIITRVEPGVYRATARKLKLGGKEEAMSQMDTWLKHFGITLSPEAMNELYEHGLYHNTELVKWNDLFTTGSKDGKTLGSTNGAFGILYNSLLETTFRPEANVIQDGAGPMDNTVVASLARLEAKYDTSTVPFVFRDNGKSIFAVTAGKFATDRTRDLKSHGDSSMRDNLSNTSFSREAFWLKLLKISTENEERIALLKGLILKEKKKEKIDEYVAEIEKLNKNDFREQFQIYHLGLTAIKQAGKRIFGDNGITAVSDIDHELTKLTQFMDMALGKVKHKGFTTYPDTKIAMRMASMFSPTMSDKSMMTMIMTAVLDLNTDNLTSGHLGQVSEDVLKVLYEQCVKPELLRMTNFASKIKETNITDYDEGAKMFLMLPRMNDIVHGPDNTRLVDLINRHPETFTMEYIENAKDGEGKEIRQKIYAMLNEYVNNLSGEKVKTWEEMGNLSQYFDATYMNKFVGDGNSKTLQAARDMVVNSMIANANHFMMFAGDPAMYFSKDKKNDAQAASIDKTYINIGKRLALLIAPGITLARSKGDTYRQLFIKDRKAIAENIRYIERLYGVDSKEAQKMRDIDITDAQEYTTWKEHLSVLSRMAKTSELLIDITQAEIDEATEIFSKPEEYPMNKLTERQKELITKVVQPIKPVYSGQQYDSNYDVMRTVYIKSSAFPLIPQLTAGFEIDKLRQAMEKLQRGKNGKEDLNVRASYQTANKVGSVTNPLDIWNEDGTINEENLKNIEASSLVLDRTNFRIQQNIPFKTEKNRDDRVTLGTQIMKLLFGDEIIMYGGYTYKGEKNVSGKDLHKAYSDAFLKMLTEKKAQLYDELGLNAQGQPINNKKTKEKLQRLLKEEAEKRGYPLQDIEGLSLIPIIKDGVIVNYEFNLPLWSSSSSNRYESMLNSVITNRLVRIKMPGRSGVVGSEEGFIKKPRLVEEQELDEKTRSKMIFTKAWNKSHLQATDEVDGVMKKAQVFVASKFRDNNGKVIDLFQMKDGHYVYITKDPVDGTFSLNEEMFDPEVLSLFTFRIPSSGHQSGTTVEIAGFLPYESGDLMIIPRNFTKQKGLDFDVDKENGYAYWTFINENGKIERMTQEHKDRYLSRVSQALKNDKDLIARRQQVKDAPTPYQKEMAMRNLKTAMEKYRELSEVYQQHYEDEDIEDSKILKTALSIFNEKIAQNDIIEIHHAVYSNPKPEVQKKINKVLNTDFVESQAKLIDSITPKSSTYPTILSDEYQKKKMALGADGKKGTGAYSLDLVFHSLAQQAAMTGHRIALLDVTDEGKISKDSKRWQFGPTNKYTTYGVLGGVDTIDGSRSITEVIGERQNMSLDNEKLQVMFRVGINNATLIVDKVFNMLGLDKGEDGNSIAMLFLSQPIIKRYVELMSNSYSIVSPFEQDKELNIIARVLEEFKAYNGYETDMSNQMTNASFIDGIKAGKNADGMLQGAVLKRFMEMRNFGLAINTVQTTINFQGNSIGKSTFDVIDKRSKLASLATMNVKDKLDPEVKVGKIAGVERLIGEYIRIENPLHREAMESLGYTVIDNYAIKPDTYMGYFNVMATTTAYDLWNEFFPYDTKMMKNKFNEIMPLISGRNDVEVKQDIFRHVKKFFNSSSRTGVISSTDNANEERRDLFIDSATNVSLARYLKTLLVTHGVGVIDEFIKTNKLINRFDFNEISANGQPSLIKCKNESGAEFDESELYSSISMMLTQRNPDGSKIKLPPVGNKEYTLDTLAQALIEYCILGNSTQQAIEFTKYIPMSYLEAVGYTMTMRTLHKELYKDVESIIPEATDEDADGAVQKSRKHNVGAFTIQYIQHNPMKVRFKRDAKTFMNEIVGADAKRLSELTSFISLANDENPTFISIYDPEVVGKKKFRLFFYDGAKYVKIPILGAIGMDEYQSGVRIGTSIINRDKAQVFAMDQIQGLTGQPESGQATDAFDIHSGNVTTVAEKISGAELGSLSALAKAIVPFVHIINKIEYTDSILVPTIKYIGEYNRRSNMISINTTEITRLNSDEQAMHILHEMVHGLTTNQIQKYIQSHVDGTVTVLDGAPSYVTNIVRLYHEARSHPSVNQTELTRVTAKARAKQNLTQQEIDDYYGFTDIYEFMAMTMANKGFQAKLKTMVDKNGANFLDRFMAVMLEILDAIGVKFEDENIAKNAMASIFEFIATENKEATKPILPKHLQDLTDEMWEEVALGEQEGYQGKAIGEPTAAELAAMDDNESFLESMGPEKTWGDIENEWIKEGPGVYRKKPKGEGPPESNRMPFPDKKLVIKEENC